MRLPVRPPLKPMLAKAAAAVPEQPSDDEPVWLYEPKWDGFRTIVFRDGDDVVLGSRNTKDLGRYFPEMVEAVKAELPERCVVDGELVVPREIDGRIRLDWEALSSRIHPAESRIRMLAEEFPAKFVGFDLLAIDDEDLTETPLRQRRERLLEIIGDGPSIHTTVATMDPGTALRWFSEFEGAGLDGVIAKRLGGRYVPDKREMVKVKHARTADVVVLGYRMHKNIHGIGSMLLGLYDGDELRMIGGAAAFTEAKRKQYLEELEPLRAGDELATGEVNRWRSSADASFVPLRPELVVEVAYDQMEGARLRHAARFVRWRPDREPRSCTYDQLEVPVNYDFADVLAGGAAEEAHG
ncbi:ATP-dependent DNA ligase [Aldersonia kunmingensis]|uniref:ATP-dependent DNA ligase n=1 Tax=Aldersonia kunmingensis TaxID=408066 RepID=UPI0008306A6B|nr:ATP-dependent DNA ligase [Aldersonia kunmingensis]